jgi:steroid delta-isomerase-like uncharacterized protein
MRRTSTAIAALFLAMGPLAGCAVPAAPPAAGAAAATADAATVERQKALIRRWQEEGDNRGNVAIADEIFAPDVVAYHPTSPTPLRGVEPIKQGALGLHAAFPGYVGTLDDLFGEGDRVTMRWTIQGVHQGPFLGIPATGKAFTLKGINIYRFAGGKVVEAWYAADMLGFFQQLGVDPPTPPAG